MNEYRIRYTASAFEDLQGIRHYFMLEWEDSLSAERLINTICEEIRKLSLMPKRYQIIEASPWKERNIHRMIVKNHLVFYRVDDTDMIVCISRVLSCRQDVKNIKC